MGARIGATMTMAGVVSIIMPRNSKNILMASRIANFEWKEVPIQVPKFWGTCSSASTLAKAEAVARINSAGRQ